MSIAALMRDMAAAGAPLEAIIMAVEAIELRDNAEAERKAKVAARKQAERDRKRDEEAMSQDVSCDSHATVTRQSSDTPIPSPSFPPNPLTNPTPAPVNNNSRARATRLAAGFELPTDWRDWAMSDRGWCRDDAEEEGRAFADFWHAKPGRDGTKLDWPATWRNWCRNSRRAAPKINGRSRQYSEVPLC